jgi:hypothetical protein
MAFSPRAFLKARRPERFSDSVPEESPSLDRSMLEYHLDTLTSRSQETDFQRFALELSKREICPNMLPQTGPTGGGDSKVDAETYPVADELSFVWHTGVGREAASERWAFAFSAKEKWRDKVQSDVAKLAATGRGYVKAFFVTNQFVPDRVRAEVEDQLRIKHSLDVRILDRTWILDRIFGGRHEALVIEELRLATSIRTRVRKGPLDVEREKEIEEVEARIREASQQRQFGLQFVDDCLNAATLARSLDRPRAEIDGLFRRAERAAKEYGTQHQSLAFAYQRAWTAYWWHEDATEFATLFGTVEEQAVGSQNAYDLELVSNLWYILHTLVRTGGLAEIEGKLSDRTATLARELERLSAEETRPSTSLQARTLRLVMRLLSSVEEADAVLGELQVVIRQCEGLVGYPLEPLAKIITEWGESLGDRSAYEGLFETLTEVMAARTGEVSAARMLLKRGAQHLDAERPFEAIRSLGRALRRLFKHESRHEAVLALYLIGHAYEQAGLLWAARGSTLTGAAVATNDFWTYADVTPQQAACYHRLKLLELRLGRLPRVLAWHEVDRAVTQVLTQGGQKIPDQSERDTIFDCLFGILFLKTELWHLGRLTAVPDVLDHLELHHSSLALQYALGHEDGLSEGFDGAMGEEAVRAVFIRWRDQPGAAELPAAPTLDDTRTVTLVSSVLGCRVTVDAENGPPYVELAESLLAALESLVSTGLRAGVLAREPILTIRVRRSDFAQAPFDFTVENRDGRPEVEVRCREFNPHAMSPEFQAQVKDGVFRLLTEVLPRVLFLGDVEQTLGTLFGDELALERSIHFTSSFVTLGNVLGDHPKTTLSDWLHPAAKTYPLLRSQEWDHEVKPVIPQGEDAQPKGEQEHGTLAVPPDAERISHSRMETHSLIREPFWDRAGWSGTAFAWVVDHSEPPVLALVFRDAEVARQIFAQWRRELGTEDSRELLRIAIIRGVEKAQPSTYRVVIGSNPAAVRSAREVQHTVMISRVHTMTPTSDRNLTAFLRAYNVAGKYLLCLAVATAAPPWVKIDDDHSIVKTQLNVREAWQIGRNDLDCTGIQETDDPVIPPTEGKAPVLDLLAWMRARSSE